MLGPQGNWRAVDGVGFQEVNPKTGAFPATLRAKKDPDATSVSISLEFIGEAITSQFGDPIPRGQVVKFQYVASN